MIKHIQSHENNTFNTSTTPFLDSWKNTLLAQAKLLGIAVSTREPIDFKAVLELVNERLLQQSESIDKLQYIVNTSSGFATVLTAQEQLYLRKAAFYNIKLNSDHWCAITDLHMFDAIDSWEKKLKEALFLGVNWRMNNYDPDGLERAIETKELACDLDAQEERKMANAYYYSSRGV